MKGYFFLIHGLQNYRFFIIPDPMLFREIFELFLFLFLLEIKDIQLFIHQHKSSFT